MSAKQHTSYVHRTPGSIRRSRWYLFLALALYGLQLTPLATASAIGAAAQPALVKCIINYQAPFAEDVLLVWGVNNWRLPDPSVRPAGSKDDGNYAITPMQALGDHKYTTTITVTQGTWIDYAFHMTKPAEMWDGEPRRQLGYHQRVEHDSRVDQYQPFVTHEIHYRMPEAGEVFLIWGVNGWRAVPEEFYPPGTVPDQNVMRTQMTYKDNIFATSLRLPAGATIDYVFIIKKTHDGEVIDLPDANGNPKRDYHTVAVDNGVTEVQATLAQLQRQAPPSEPSFNFYEYTFTLMIWIAIIAGGLGLLLWVISVIGRRAWPQA